MHLVHPIRSAVSVIALAILSSISVNAEDIEHRLLSDGKTEVWLIREPVVNQPLTEYQQIRFVPGDSVHFDATGCVQTGGHGLTSKRYVSPSGDNSDRLYYGTVWIPGVVGDSASAMRRFKDINGSQVFTIPANINTTAAYLRLGYLDDGYSDNGYTSQDNGTQNQCLNQPNASVRVTIVHGAGGGTNPTLAPLPFDLLSDNNYDDNLIPLNPHWGYQQLHNGLPPSAEKLCAVTVPNPNGRPDVFYYPDYPMCTRQPTSRDDSFWCGPHGNWGPATVVGSIVWESHSTGHTGDDDYSWYLTPPNGNGLTATRTTLEPEFKAAETIDHFSTPWWNDFHTAVDQGGTGPNTLVDGKLAIVSGLFSLDFEHSIHAEVHPVFAMAIRVKEDPTDETWVLFARRFGNEGFCSSHMHYLDYLPNDQFIFRLPLAWGAGATLASQDVNFTPDPETPTVTFVPNHGVLVTFNMNQNRDARQLISGEIHLHWNNANTADLKRVAVVTRDQEPATKEQGTEEYYQGLVQNLTPAQAAQLNALLPPKPPVPRPLPHLISIHSVALVGKLPDRPVGMRHPSVSSVLDANKVQGDKLLIESIHKVAQIPLPPPRPQVPIRVSAQEPVRKP